MRKVGGRYRRNCVNHNWNHNHFGAIVTGGTCPAQLCVCLVRGQNHAAHALAPHLRERGGEREEGREKGEGCVKLRR